MTGRRVVYITYDGLSDPLGQSQVLPYVDGLAARGHHFHLLSFEKPGNPLTWRTLRGPRVAWTATRYHKTPTVPATAFDMLQGLTIAAAVARLRGADLLHVRSYVAATMALPLARAAGVPLLFDMRGLWADEKVDAGHWPRDGRLYRGAKAVERRLLAGADTITVLTNDLQRLLRHEHAHRDEIRAPISVIPTCADLDVFSPDAPVDAPLAAELGDARVLSYVGSFGTWYMADEMARFYLAWRRHVPRARLLVISRDDPSPMRRVLADHDAADELVHRPSSRTEVASRIRASHASVCFVRPTYSKRGSAATKVGELLGCGVPIAANVIGDVRDVLGDPRVGVVLEAMDDEALDDAARRLARLSEQAEVRARTRAQAERWFSLARAVDAYDAIYRGEVRDDRSWP